MLKILKIQKSIFFLLIALIIFLFFFGFYLDENSAGAGGYKGDITWILENIKIFKENNLKDAIFHKDLFGNRPPLIYILNKIFNPYFYNYEKYRYIVFFISLTGLYFLFLGIKIKHNKSDKTLLFLIASVILLSPYFRTSAYWALNENYGLLTSIFSLTLLNYCKNDLDKSKISLIKIYSLVLVSSITVYFDQKLIIITMISFFFLITKSINFKIKLNIFILYSLMSIPFLILIYHWKGLAPHLTQIENPNSILSFKKINKLYLYNLGYTCTIIAFYILPFLFLKKKSILDQFKDFFKSKKNFFFITIPIIYIFLLKKFFIFKEYTIDNYWIGFGYVHKIAKLLFKNITFQEYFTYFAVICSWIVICVYTNNNIKKVIVFFYFFLISLLFWPLMQEYFDPIIFIIVLLFLDDEYEINFKNTIFFVGYFFIFLIVSNIYYFRLFNQN